VVATLPLFGKYVTYLSHLIGIAIILALGINIFWGLCGQIQFGAAGFYAVGAYACALLQAKLGWHVAYALPAAVLASLLIGLVTAPALLRLKIHTLALGTMAFALVVYYWLETTASVTGGEEGLRVLAAYVSGYRLGPVFYYYLITLFVILGFIVAERFKRCKIGRAWMAIREDEGCAAVMGINVGRYKLLAFLICCGYLGLGGALFAQQSGWITPMSFGIFYNVTIIFPVIVGGLGSNWGCILGGVVMTLLPQVLSGMQQYQVLVYGFLLAGLMFAPKGLASLLEEGTRKLWRTFSVVAHTGDKTEDRQHCGEN
jgi:branched-chain amino acid transport system permease protein